MAIFTPDGLEAAAHLLNSIDVTAEPLAITCTDIIEVLLASREKKDQYEKTIVILHQQLTDARARIVSLECKLHDAHNWPLVSGSTQTDPPPALCNAGTQTAQVLRDSAAQASPSTCESGCQASPPPPSPTPLQISASIQTSPPPQPLPLPVSYTQAAKPAVMVALVSLCFHS